MIYQNPSLESKRKRRIAALFAWARQRRLSSADLHLAIAAALMRESVSIAKLTLPELRQTLDYLNGKNPGDSQPEPRPGPTVAFQNSPTPDQIAKVTVLADILAWHKPGTHDVDPARWKGFGAKRIAGTSDSPVPFAKWTRSDMQNVIEALKAMILRNPSLAPLLQRYEPVRSSSSSSSPSSSSSSSAQSAQSADRSSSPSYPHPNQEPSHANHP